LISYAISMKRTASSAPRQLSLFDAVPPKERRARETRPDESVTTPASPVAPSRPQSRASRATTAPALLTTQEAADLLHVHPRTVQRLVERGQLAAVHVGTAVRFDRSDLAELTARLKSRAARPPIARAEVTPARGRGAHVSFADRLRSQRDEHRAA
jgi:excisionase family DNA binding protein